MLSHFRQYDKKDILALTHTRLFETKLGEMVCGSTASEDIETMIKNTTARYIIFGIAEDIGVKANLGKGGADSSWFSFLDSFLNIQSNDFLSGHNNAYPAIKGAAKGLFKTELIPLAQINCINLDAHTDYRPLEGRHSGNPFRYADEDGYLNKYCVVGIHENYLQQNVWIDIVNNPFMDCITFEDIFIHEKRSFIQAVSHATGFTEDNYTGVELDLDSIENVLCSASTPSGISTLHARQYLNFAAMDSKVAYVHICEGATKLSTGATDPSTGKLISYLVSDFVKAHLRRIEL